MEQVEDYCEICGGPHDYAIFSTEEGEAQVISPTGIESEEKISDL